MQWCQLFCDEGFQVVRFDNRDVGLSSKLDGIDYSLADMGDDEMCIRDSADTDPRELIGLVAAPIYYRLLVTDEPINPAVADRAAVAALAAARAGVLSGFLPTQSTRNTNRGRRPRLRASPADLEAT